MSSITTPTFIQAFERYHSDRMFSSALKSVGDRFLECTERSSITGIMYTTLSLLLAQAMEDMLSGYSGSSVTDKRYLSEAIGYDLGGSRVVNFVSNGRYLILINTVTALQQAHPEFAKIIDNFIKQQRQEIKS
jgi:hypothetical protein